MKKNFLFLALTIVVSLLSLTSTAQVTVSGSATQDGIYSTLGAAIATIGTSQSGQTISIALSASTTETASVVIGNGSWTSLTIFPSASGVTISGAVASGSLIALTSATKVTIDGRVNQAGAVDMTINNTDQGSSTITFTSDAQYNTVKYCTIKGGHTAGVFGIISFSATTSITGGNGYNTIDHNVITNNGTNELYAIYAVGNITKPNLDNQITNNEFKDVLSPANPSSAIYILGNASGPQNNNFTISGNSFYQTSALAATAGSNRWFIQIGTSAAPAGSHTITGNYIGGRSANCGGLALTKTGTTSNLYGIVIYTSGTGTANIQGNTIQNISWTNAIQAATSFILVGGTGNANIGTTTGNTIGGNTGTGSIVMNYNTANSTTNGIQITCTGTVDCQNNKIGSITTCNQSSGFTAPFLAITKTATAGTVTISNNVIGSTSTANSIYAYNSVAVVPSQILYGIQFLGSGTATISNNTIANITNNTTTGSLHGIYAGSVTSTVTINSNLIHSLGITGFTGTGAVNGILVLGGGSATNTATITNNIIKLGDDNAYILNGINDAANSANTNIYHNTVYLTGAPTSGAFKSVSLWSGGSANNRNYRNNILVNSRSGGTGKHYALQLQTYVSGTFVEDYNDYVSTGATGGVLALIGATEATTLSELKDATTLDVNSTNTDPVFTNAGGTLATDYKPTILISGLSSTGVTTDYAGTTRTVFTKGAWEVTEISTQNINTVSTKLSIYSANGQLFIAGVKANQQIEIFNAVGQKLTTLIAHEGLNLLQVQSKGMLIVKAGVDVEKVLVK